MFTRSAVSAGSFIAAITDRGLGGAELLPPHPREPLGVGVERPPRPAGVESSIPASSSARSRTARRRTALTSPAAAAARRLPASLPRDARLRQLDGLVDGGVVGRRAGLEQLEEAESKRGQHRRVQAVGGPAGEQLDQMVGRAAALDRAVGEPLRLGSLPGVEAVPLGGGRECAVRPRVVLEHPAENLVGGAAPGRHVDGSRPAAITSLARARRSCGGGWPRR